MESGGEHNFQNLCSYKFASIENADVKTNLAKWSMIDGLRLQAYSFDKPFKKYNERAFIVDFFGSSNVVSTLLKAAPGHGFSPLGFPGETVKFSEVPCTLTTLHLFEKLKDGNKIVRQNGSIVKCMPHYIDACIDGKDQTFEMEIADNLRKFILSDKNEDYDDDLEDIGEVLSDAERKEFLFLVFSHFVLGGSLCQYEDNVEPYLEATRALYKDLISVARAQGETETGGGGDTNDRLKVVSHVYRIHSVTSSVSPQTKNLLFHREYLNNFFYLIVNPLKQLCFVLYHHA